MSSSSATLKPGPLRPRKAARARTATATTSVVRTSCPAGATAVPQRPSQEQPPAERAASAAPAVARRNPSRTVSATDASLSPAQLRWYADHQASPGRRLLGSAPFLTVAFAGSVLLHLIVLSIHFRPEIDRMLDRGPALAVALVNAKTKNRPAQAEVLAQANLDGGGNTDADRRARTPLPVIPRESQRTEIAAAPDQVELLERQAQDLMTQLKSAPVAPLSGNTGDAVEQPEAPSTGELTRRTLEAMRLEAQVAKELDAYQKRPKRRFVGARAEEYRFARYVEDWRLKVERIGNLNYPEAARQMKLYGSLLLSVAIRADGSLDNVEVHRSSGRRVLDAAAIRIVEMGAPYAPLPAEIRRDTDVLVITRTWSFTKGEELRSE